MARMRAHGSLFEACAQRYRLSYLVLLGISSFAAYPLSTVTSMVHSDIENRL